MRRLIVLPVLLLLSAPVGGLAAGDAAAASSRTPRYSVQVRAVPPVEKADGLATYRALRDKGYLAYVVEAEVAGAKWLRVRVGAFATRQEADSFGRTLSAKEGLDHFVTEAPLKVLHAAGERALLAAPGALWLLEAERDREILDLTDAGDGNGNGLLAVRPAPSPNGRGVLFVYRDRLYGVDLEAGTARMLAAEGEFDAYFHGQRPLRLLWSPSGRYVAFVDFVDFEAPTSLWVVRADGSERLCLIDNRDPRSQSAVKDFIWHPTEDRILFIEGYAFGTVSPGGSIHSLDMDGNRTPVLANRKQVQFVGPMRTDDNYLHYGKLTFDENFIDATRTEERLPISGL
ncbi:MAG: SPOR domain-containing protein [Rhodospirillales bacterium]|nr:SPOR domain-containing protein [Rhodospirillales bacterium]MDH3790558.1 SPOR domain-containing protein [Rhodospirillales bacterium]MDH3918295.1 SPOR domain-containing protein [Rhodospirillales bacterium]MDH3970000.1 SPOR domain-containing protein [Rhodospirillales bacterium]